MTQLLGAEHVEKVGQEIKESSSRLSTVLSNLIKSIDDFSKSSNKFATFQKRQQILMCILTAILVTVGVFQALIMNKQSEIMKKQSEIMDKQAEIMRLGPRIPVMPGR